MNIGLFFGSFNPIHTGHLIIASFVANNTPMNQVWLVVSPQNPLKPKGQLLNEYHRLRLVQLAVEDDNQLRASDIEFKLPRPSYTIDTLTHLKEKYPQHSFSIIVGSDSYLNIGKWKNGDILLRDYDMFVYERPGFQSEQIHDRASLLKAPLLDISASAIRSYITNGKSIRYMIPDKTREEIENNHYYR
ncbi:MAG: nicotinic acid mononucleotide adenylyltransferase [Chitinophagaceae bacterium]|nr:nicotinic acid mononucleotide adenylyltransferase [Chitinophagaceae bacterium]